MNQIAGSLKRSLKLKNYSKLIIKKKKLPIPERNRGYHYRHQQDNKGVL